MKITLLKYVPFIEFLELSKIKKEIWYNILWSKSYDRKTNCILVLKEIEDD